MRIFILVTTCLLSGCVFLRPQTEWDFGVAPEKQGYIPARIAPLLCTTWPERSTRPAFLPLIAMSATDEQELCQAFDQFILDGFDNQPFMKGITPNRLIKIVTASNPDFSIMEWKKLWAQKSSDDPQAANLPTFYERSIATRSDWLLWLNNLSRLTNGSDAVLLPILLYAGSTTERDRGFNIARRSASVALLLIDIDTGHLLWSGHRPAEVLNKGLADPSVQTKPTLPDLESLKKRLFTESIWLNFPGRQVFK